MTGGPRGDHGRPLNSFSADWAAATQLGGGGWIDKVGVQALLPSPPSSPSLLDDHACRWSGGISAPQALLWLPQLFLPSRKSWGQARMVILGCAQGNTWMSKERSSPGCLKAEGFSSSGKFWLSINWGCTGC